MKTLVIFAILAVTVSATFVEKPADEAKNAPKVPVIAYPNYYYPYAHYYYPASYYKHIGAPVSAYSYSYGQYYYPSANYKYAPLVHYVP